ncbi:MAG: glycosyltransferase family 4 protein [Bacteroidales bacterium]|nr:glycosyltransferase family 4 protein [Bacteroidales bacterium]
MKILHITPNIETGGVQSLIYEFGKYQLKHGHDVDVLYLRNDESLYYKEKDYFDAGVKVIRGRYPKTYDPRNILVIREYLCAYDIVHVHLFPNQLYAKIAQMLVPRQKRPVLITTEHNTYNNRRKYSMLRLLDRWFYKSYDKIVCISRQTKENIDKWLCSESLSEKTVTITNGVDLEKFSSAPDRLSEAIQLEPGAKYIVMVARMTHPKDPITLIKAIALCDNSVHGVFIGSGPLESSMAAEAESLGISSRIHMLGNRTNVEELIKGCDIGVLSTLWDGFGLVAVEYMAAGLPVLATDVDGLCEVVGDKELLFSYGDTKSLAKKITQLLSDQDYLESKKRYCASRCMEFSIDRMNSEYLELYKKLNR